jgi:hypothetical protein
MAAQHTLSLSNTIPKLVERMKSSEIQLPSDFKSEEVAGNWFDEIVRHGTDSEKASLASVLTGKEINSNMVPHLVRQQFFELAKEQLSRSGAGSFQSLRAEADPLFRSLRGGSEFQTQKT